ncbi:hypothetical protein TVAG_151040 [Trichomonas vaginalis G3]|uniref:PCI domain-containing protein n=1 Tax=Trichomonas vaginalis (strain ATCC PRA-98 / G3) TaxID=412133 RepID=A2FM16_TRIV3|nr:26S proteasome non-ATPase regulatory subunit 11/COP9 signalosome complex subunit 2 family [Trichomonas vaginalis G3]EAX94057.1 hypothetical protein TVAG_151040 [Trichomonas vaginalis G3]KAI5548213.1 26S proteasome non-ATPase regulatory subunit 11/COP9 signalosome complex subunit 2 family [Trichomonas vaginalis G3]|eukprot:XP_001306987.1 hypothetical protein [Trichomonas vaginalis G3]
MSEEEEVVYEEEEVVEVEEEEQEEQSAEVSYEQGKDNLNYNDSLALDLFLKVMNDDSAEDHLKAKATSHLLILLAKEGVDLDSLLAVFDNFYSFVKANCIKVSRFDRTMNQVATNILHHPEVQYAFLSHAAKELDPNSLDYRKWALESQMQLIELELGKGKLEDAIKLIDHVHQYIPDDPDTSDIVMTGFSIRLLVILLEINLNKGNDAEVRRIYEKCVKIQEIRTLSSYQTALITFVAGRLQLDGNLIEQASSSFKASFNTFVQIGSENRRKVLPYYILTNMLCHRLENLLAEPAIGIERIHPDVAPIASLFDSYFDYDVVSYKNRVNDVKQYFNSPKISGFLDDIKNFVMKYNLVKIFKNYSQVEIKFLLMSTYTESEKAELEKLSPADKAKRLDRDLKVVIDFLYDLILSKKLSASIDFVNNILVAYEKRESLYIESVQAIFNYLQGISNGLVKATKLKLEEPNKPVQIDQNSLAPQYQTN